jgi:hypothetical protein
MMSKYKDKLKLHKELQSFNADALQYKMTAILLSVNGYNSAMRFVQSIKPKGQLKLHL